MPYKKLSTNNLLSFCLIIFLLIISDRSSAQAITNLNDVTSIELVKQRGGLIPSYLQIEVDKEDGVWKSYQTRVKKPTPQGLINDSSRTFIRVIPADMLSRLFDIINKRDTSINITLFNLNNNELVHMVDSLYPKLSVAQRDKMLKTLASKDTMQKALVKVLHPGPMVEKTYYSITAKTEKDQPMVITALNFANLYYLPWHIDGAESYDPNISLIYNYLCGYDELDAVHRRFLNQSLVMEIYRKYVQARLK